MAAKKSSKVKVYAKVERVALDPTTLYRSARLRAAVTQSGAFRCPPKGVTKSGDSAEAVDCRNVLMGLPTRARSKEILLECPVQLVLADEDVLVVLLAIAASSVRRRQLNTFFQDRKCLNEGKGRGDAIVIEVERSELVDLLGWGRNSVSYEAVFHSLVRLAHATVSETSSTSEVRSTNLIGFPDIPWSEEPSNSPWPPVWVPNQERKSLDEEDGEIRWIRKGPVAVVISSFLSDPVLNTDSKLLFGLHMLHERRSLSTTARGLYSHLVATSWPGKTKRVPWDPILKKLYGKKPSSILRSAAFRLTKRFPGGWELKIQGRGVRAYIEITRPPLITRALRNKAAAEQSPTPDKA